MILGTQREQMARVVSRATYANQTKNLTIANRILYNL